jgi:putative heme iron utilization protein
MTDDETVKQAPARPLAENASVDPLRVSLAATIRASKSCNASFLAAAAEFAKILAEAADAAVSITAREKTDANKTK